MAQNEHLQDRGGHESKRLAGVADIQKLQVLMESCSQILGIQSAVVDLHGT